MNNLVSKFTLLLFIISIFTLTGCAEEEITGTSTGAGEEAATPGVPGPGNNTIPVTIPETPVTGDEKPEGGEGEGRGGGGAPRCGGGALRVRAALELMTGGGRATREESRKW